MPYLTNEIFAYLFCNNPKTYYLCTPISTKM